jgi:hypothetical protein
LDVHLELLEDFLVEEQHCTTLLKLESSVAVPDCQRHLMMQSPHRRDNCFHREDVDLKKYILEVEVMTTVTVVLLMTAILWCQSVAIDSVTMATLAAAMEVMMVTLATTMMKVATTEPRQL